MSGLRKTAISSSVVQWRNQWSLTGHFHVGIAGSVAVGTVGRELKHFVLQIRRFPIFSLYLLFFAFKNTNESVLLSTPIKIIHIDLRVLIGCAQILDETVATDVSQDLEVRHRVFNLNIISIRHGQGVLTLGGSRVLMIHQCRFSEGGSGGLIFTPHILKNRGFRNSQRQGQPHPLAMSDNHTYKSELFVSVLQVIYFDQKIADLLSRLGIDV